MVGQAGTEPNGYSNTNCWEQTTTLYSQHFSPGPHPTPSPRGKAPDCIPHPAQTNHHSPVCRKDSPTSIPKPQPGESPQSLTGARFLTLTGCCIRRHLGLFLSPFCR